MQEALYRSLSWILLGRAGNVEFGEKCGEKCRESRFEKYGAFPKCIIYSKNVSFYTLVVTKCTSTSITLLASLVLKYYDTL